MSSHFHNSHHHSHHQSCSCSTKESGSPDQATLHCPVCHTPLLLLQDGSVVQAGQQQQNEQKPKQPWKKVLYEKQEYEDNYVGETFLAGMIKNAHVQPYDFWSVVRESIVVSQQLSIVALFVIIFKHTLDKNISEYFLASLDFILVLGGYIARALVDPHYNVEEAVTHFFRLFWIIAVLLAFSPVLRTLTVTYTNDTIWSLTIFLLAVHLFAHDYSYVNAYTNRFKGNLSLNAAVFVSILFASRLPTSIHSFALITLAILLFALFPILRHHLKKYSVELHKALFMVMFGLTSALLVPMSTLLTITYMSTIVFITFVCPSWLIYIQKYKDEIQGPWDEAVPGNMYGMFQEK